MQQDNIVPSTITSIKRLAKQTRKETDLSYTQALDFASKRAGCQNFAHARKILKDGSGFTERDTTLYLTVYWTEKKPLRWGHETLQLEVSRPINKICNRSQMKHVRSLGFMRSVASDHLISDTFASSQHEARNLICQVGRVICFMDVTGLKPLNDFQAVDPDRNHESRLPGRDHFSEWYDPKTGENFFVDEPYEPAAAHHTEERKNWAIRHDWYLVKLNWPGMYYPYNCDMFLFGPNSKNSAMEELKEKIEKMPRPLTVDNWSGVSASGLDVFYSPKATTKQDRRRAKPKCLMYSQPSKATIPYSSYGGSKRRPNATMPVEEHVDVGQMIKSIIESDTRPYGVYRRMDSLRSNLEDWLGLEVGPRGLPGPEFFDVYYHGADKQSPYTKMAKTYSGVIAILKKIKSKLFQYYPDCAPLRQQIRKIDTSISMLQKRT